MIISEIVSIFTVRHLLNCKTFVKKSNTKTNDEKENEDDAILMV
jgi:hypothetical protein